MKILFGVQGTGNGHLARSREVIAALQALGHEVRVLVSGQPLPGFWRGPEFDNVAERKGLTFTTRSGKVSYLASAGRLDLMTLLRDVRTLDVSGYDVVISDYEPIVVRAARRHRRPSIGIGHQYAFGFRIPVAGRDPIARLTLSRFAPVDHPIGLHWHHYGAPILPPIIARDIDPRREQVPGKVLVYLPHIDRRLTVSTLRGLRDYRFHVYDRVEAHERHGNVTLCPFSRDGFLVDLDECEAVLCHAGFELPSEALHLGKRLMVIPVGRQLEQASNALSLSQLSLARVAGGIDEGAVAQWLQEPAPEPRSYPDVAGAIAELISAGHWEDPAPIVAAVWDRVGEPRT